MELDDHDGPRAFRAATDTPDSPSPRTVDLARKRAASINTAEANYARFEHLRLNTPTNMNKDSPRDHICLCTPAPKIPRPRNGESRIFFVVIVFVVVVIGAPASCVVKTQTARFERPLMSRQQLSKLCFQD